MNNYEFFMEASKNPDIKARKRTVKNLRKLGVDRAHEVDDKKLKSGIDINVKDSYGDKRKVRISSNNIYPDAYIDNLGTINITPETMNSNKFESTFNHEAGHLEQIKRKDYNTSDTKSKTTYAVFDKDSYPIKCAKLFLQKNAGKMNDHDREWTELHADFLSCKKIGFGKMMKLIHSLKKSKQKIESACDELTKWNDNCCKNLVDLYSRYTVKDKAHGDYERPLTQEEVEDIFSLYNKSKEKLEHYRNILMERFYDLEDKSDEDNLSADYQKKLSKLMRKIFDKSKEISNKLQDFAEIYKHHGVNINNAQSFNTEMKLQLDSFNHQLRDCKSYSTTYDYRIKFIEDMKLIHDGHPGRCSIKYPPMTPEDKKYMQEFTVEEMYLSNIITESEYVQLQERIQILTERSE